MKVFISLLVLLCCGEVSSQTELVRPAPANRLTLEASEFGEIRTEGNEGTLSVITHEQPKNIYNLSKTFSLREWKGKAGQWLLLTFRARTKSASLETGEAKALWLVKQSGSHKDNLARTVSIGSEWREYSFPVQLTRNVSGEDLSLALQFGYLPQEFLLADVSLMVYPAGFDGTDLPRTRLSYPGRAVDADWRAEAEQRIDRHRKGGISLRFLDTDGEPVTGAKVVLEQRNHDFGWGAAINARRIADDPAELDRIAGAFNTVVFENDLKIKRWGDSSMRSTTLSVLNSLTVRGLRVKGHVLVWPGFRYLPPSVHGMRDDPAAVTELMRDHVAGILAATRGKISHWDVVNEAYSNRDLQEITGSEEILYAAFRTVAAADSSIGRFTNEFGIISRGGHDGQKQEWYRDYIRRLDRETGGLVDGIGIQCHMGSDLTPPERVYELLEYYAALGKRISISEFTIDVDDPELRFDYTRDFLTMAFSHPAVSEFLFWGYDQTTHPSAAIFAADGSPADMGLAFFHLVHELWQTRIAGASDPTGRIQGRGFYGDYRYRVEVDGRVSEGSFELPAGGAAVLDIRLPKR